MRTLVALAFIAGMAAVAVGLARTPTVADGRVVAADLLEDVRKDGVTELDDWVLKPDGPPEAKPQPPTRGPRPQLRKPSHGDPWAERP
jgi:hypothetical protein